MFLTKLKGHLNLFVTGKFLYSQYRNKEENTEGTENPFLYKWIFVKSVFVRTILDYTKFEMKYRQTTKTDKDSKEIGKDRHDGRGTE